MESWGKQNFLNPVNSRDDGWFKFGLEYEATDRHININSKFCISDCSNKINLEFDLSIWKSGFTQKDFDKEVIKLRERRAKVKMFKDAIDEWYEEITTMYDQYELEMNKFMKKVIRKKNEKS